MSKITRYVILVLLLSASAAAQTTHGIKLTWTQGTCTVPCVVIQNTVYRAAVNTGPFTAIFTSSAAITSYLDPLTSTNQGTNACYVVTAWTTTTIESPQSSPPACNTFPVQAGAPSSVQTSQQ